MSQPVIQNLSRISYDDAMSLMDELHRRRVTDAIPDTILVLEHDPVITKGRRLHGVAVPREAELTAKGVAIRESDRGGLLTYHGPGQVVIYFVMRLDGRFEGVATLVARIESILVSFLASKGVIGTPSVAHPGIWVGDKKIASIGLRVEKGVTKHGVSFNVANDLSVYRMFDPCGLTGDTMTNWTNLCGAVVGDDFFKNFAMELADAFRRGLTHDDRATMTG